MKRFVRLVLLLPPLAALAEDPASIRYVLRGGGEVKGFPLKETPEQVVIDVGPSLVTLPRSAILEQKKDGAETAAKPGAATAEDLYFVSASRPESPVEKLVNEVGEAVVEIRSKTSIGSGFVIHPDGFVMTNHHVINGETKFTLTLFRREAGTLSKVLFKNIRIVAMDPTRDLALLKIDDKVEKPFQHVTIGDSDSVNPGQGVFAVGSPLGLDRTVSQGIVSLPNRLMENGLLFIQTTAQINPGNSGGPLFNLSGEVVGVNNRKAAQVGVEGVGFAIPSNVLKYFLKKRDAFAFDPRNPNTGFTYLAPPRKLAHPPATAPESLPPTKE
ncbi:MAG: trypsin-like peptidase domain-containing protein [Kiritimatiellia bacterium]